MRCSASRSPARASLYPFFAAYLGWLGVFLTGSDTASNALFGSLQRITAQQLNLNEVLIVATNSTGGVMGKMIDAQSIMVACAACYDDPARADSRDGPDLPHGLVALGRRAPRSSGSSRCCRRTFSPG